MLDPGWRQQRARVFAGVWLGASERRIVAQIWRYFSPAHATSPSLSSAAADRWRTLLSVCNWRRCQHCAALIGRLLRRMRTQPLPPLYRESGVAWRLFSHSVLCFLLLVCVVILSCLVELRSLLLHRVNCRHRICGHDTFAILCV